MFKKIWIYVAVLFFITDNQPIIFAALVQPTDLGLSSKFKPNQLFTDLQAKIKKDVGISIFKLSKKGIPTYINVSPHMTHLYGIEDSDRGCLEKTIVQVLNSQGACLINELKKYFKDNNVILGKNADIILLNKTIVLKLRLPQVWDLAPQFEKEITKKCNIAVTHTSRFPLWVPHITLVTIAGGKDGEQHVVENLVIKKAIDTILREINNAHKGFSVGKIDLQQIQLTTVTRAPGKSPEYTAVAQFAYGNGKWKSQSDVSLKKKIEEKKEVATGWTSDYDQVVAYMMANDPQKAIGVIFDHGINVRTKGPSGTLRDIAKNIKENVLKKVKTGEEWDDLMLLLEQ